jgi:L-fuconolactonase
VTAGAPDPAERMQRWEHWLALRQERALDPDLPIIDPHHHLWDRGGHRYLADEFLADAAGGHKLLASVYVECLSNYREDGPEALRCVGETEFVAGIAQRSTSGHGTRLCAGIVARADLALGAAVEEVLDAHAQAAQGRLRGIRYSSAWDASPAIHAAYPTRPGMLRETSVQAGASCLARRNLSFDAWLYFHQLGDVAALARACPDLTIVLDHCGGPIGLGPYAQQRDVVFEQWRESLRTLRGFDNIVLKFGGLAMPLAGFGWHRAATPPSSTDLAAAWRPYFDVSMELFGPQRCMFESNFPVDRSGCSYTVLWNAFKLLAGSLSVDERADLCAGTARRIYRL